MSEPVLQSRRSLYVGGLADKVTESNLRAVMLPFGPIKSIEIPMDYSSGSNRGFAFVEYTDADDASEAIYNLDGSELYGKVLSVSLAKEGQGRLDTNKAVWSTDEFFQETMGQGEKQQDVAAESLKEGGVKL